VSSDVTEREGLGPEPDDGNELLVVVWLMSSSKAGTTHVSRGRYSLSERSLDGAAGSGGCCLGAPTETKGVVGKSGTFFLGNALVKKSPICPTSSDALEGGRAAATDSTSCSAPSRSRFDRCRSCSCPASTCCRNSASCATVILPDNTAWLRLCTGVAELLGEATATGA
jgi:hypothetical protein